MCGNAMSSQIDPVTVSASGKHTATVIFLHGLGDTGHGWSYALSEIRQPHIKYICPTAPKMPVTLNEGYEMTSWFDLYTLNIGGREDEAGIKKAAALVQGMVEEEEKGGIPSNRIVLGGFSQGGALALYAAFTLEKPLAGMVALSSWLPLHESFPDAMKVNNESPILQCHGDMDPVVPYKFGQMTKSVLSKMCSNYTFNTYPGMMHSSSAKEMQDVKEFLDKVLPAV
ncbi:acyl-protein thioesterase 2-like [Branchiostoma floridae]|uniref:palmitoyl-protein hydrolase n=1 Tax=Branchiostoma floridae TaxID=7739 RepID=A0A9J7MHJ3_BRAFL|nr:acyl-protein thioesterase 2-like [Branchiostoma floridae]